MVLHAYVTAHIRPCQVLLLCNGSYGHRQTQICRVAGIPYVALDRPEDRALELADVETLLTSDTFTAVTVVHCETSSGVLNPVEPIGRLVRRLQPAAAFVVDAMSAFGAVPLDLERAGVDYLVSSANKCIEGVPGFGFALCRLKHLETTEGEEILVRVLLVE